MGINTLYVFVLQGRMLSKQGTYGYVPYFWAAKLVIRPSQKKIQFRIVLSQVILNELINLYKKIVILIILINIWFVMEYIFII